MAISHFRHKLGIKFVCTGQTLLRNKYLEIFDSILPFFFAEFVHLAHWPLTASPDYLLICLTVNLAWCYAFKSAKVRHYWFHLGHQLFRKKSSLWKRLQKKYNHKNFYHYTNSFPKSWSSLWKVRALQRLSIVLCFFDLDTSINFAFIWKEDILWTVSLGPPARLWIQ